jgi:glycosyltransferase involved in cell wall biosynthesis
MNQQSIRHAFEVPNTLARADGLRIALFSGNYNYTRDGANNALNRLVGHLLDQGAAVRIYSPTSGTPAFEPTGDLVSVRSIPIPGRSEFRVALGLPRAVRDDLRRFAPNIVHVSAPDWLGTAAQRFARSLDVPVVASMHTRFETYFDYYRLGVLRSWAWNVQRRFYLASDRVLVPNEPSKDHLVEMGIPPAQIGIWGRGVDSRFFSPHARDSGWRRAAGYADDDIVVCFFGRLVREKGIECFVQTIRELRSRGHLIKPLIIGDGPEFRRMKNEIGEAAFTGHLEGAALGRAVASADILLNPSLTEAFGNVNLEAMAAGLAVISADVESARAIITDGKDGVLCMPTVNAFADTIERLTHDTALMKQTRAAAILTAAQYRWRDKLDSVVRVYRGMLVRRDQEVRRP